MAAKDKKREKDIYTAVYQVTCTMKQMPLGKAYLSMEVGIVILTVLFSLIFWCRWSVLVVTTCSLFKLLERPLFALFGMVVSGLGSLGLSGLHGWLPNRCKRKQKDLSRVAS